MSEQTKFRRFPFFSCGLVCYCFCCCCFKLAWKWFIFESNVDIFTADQNFQFRRALIYTRDHLHSDCQLLIKTEVLKKWILISFKKADFETRSPLSANPTKWSNSLKSFNSKLATNCLSVFNHFVGLALKVGLSRLRKFLPN